MKGLELVQAKINKPPVLIDVASWFEITSSLFKATKVFGSKLKPHGSVMQPATVTSIGFSAMLLTPDSTFCRRQQISRAPRLLEAILAAILAAILTILNFYF